MAERAAQVLATLSELADRSRLEGMRRYGINTGRALGVTVTELRTLARRLGRDHELALALWGSEIHEARILASMVDEPALVTKAQMGAWVRGFDSWDLCDQVCGNLFDRTPHAFDMAVAWSARRAELTKRAGFALMAWTAVHRREVADERFETFLPIIEAHSNDDRNYVRKAVSWALRQIGKRSSHLHTRAIETARQIGRGDSRAARWVARDALRELESRAVRQRLGALAAPADDQRSSRAGASSRSSATQGS